MVVPLHHRVHVGHPVQQIGKALSVEEDRPVGDGALLLHGPYPLAEELVLCGLLGLHFLALFLLLCDLFVIIGDLGVDGIDLVIDGFQLLGKDLPLLLGGSLILLRLGQFLLQLLLPGLAGGLLLLQGVNLTLGYRPHVLHDHAEDGQKQQQGHGPGQHAHEDPTAIYLIPLTS